MGWKNVKKFFNLEDYTLYHQGDDRLFVWHPSGVHIGYFSTDGEFHYTSPQSTQGKVLIFAKKMFWGQDVILVRKKVADLLKEPDTFEHDYSTYQVDNGLILEYTCETKELGSVTHCGKLMEGAWFWDYKHAEEFARKWIDEKMKECVETIQYQKQVMETLSQARHALEAGLVEQKVFKKPTKSLADLMAYAQLIATDSITKEVGSILTNDNELWELNKDTGEFEKQSELTEPISYSKSLILEIEEDIDEVIGLTKELQSMGYTVYQYDKNGVEGPSFKMELFVFTDGMSKDSFYDKLELITQVIENKPKTAVRIVNYTKDMGGVIASELEDLWGKYGGSRLSVTTINKLFFGLNNIKKIANTLIESHFKTK